MRFRTQVLLNLLLLLFFVSGCSEQPKRMPDTLPDVQGYIGDIKHSNSKSGAAKAVIRVKALEGLEADYPDASISIDEHTLIEDATGKRLKLNQLRTGYEVKAWFEGDALETMPVQGYAKAIRIGE